MRRWLLILLAVLLPLQLAWANAPEHCVDGHALHHHEANVADLEDGDAPPPSSDCGHCQGHFSALPLSLGLRSAAPARFEAIPLAPPRVASRPVPRPERPQWQALA